MKIKLYSPRALDKKLPTGNYNVRLPMIHRENRIKPHWLYFGLSRNYYKKIARKAREVTETQQSANLKITFYTVKADGATFKFPDVFVKKIYK